MTGPVPTLPAGRVLTRLQEAQARLIDAMARADYSEITAATAEFRLALRDLEHGDRSFASAPALTELARSQGVLRESLRARLAQARAALDALGFEANRYRRDASVGYGAA